jgi:uncharacterized metal-binding protein
MPSGRTHDAITFLLAFPACAAVSTVTNSLSAAAVVGIAFVFGGLMFGPDLDTVSRQYSRWSVFRFMWYPYRSFFKHRSRFSHGLVFGALLRVIYFMGVVTLVVFVVALAWSAVGGTRSIGTGSLVEAWRGLGSYIRLHLGENFLLLTFAGLWIGAASHTFTDIAGTFIKTGRSEKFF